MKLRELTSDERDECQRISLGSYAPYLISENNKWVIALKPVLFGTRVIIYSNDEQETVPVDYCAGSDNSFAIQLLVVLAEIMRHLPEEMSSADLVELMPEWSVRPIDRDPCWHRLQEMALASRSVSGAISVPNTRETSPESV